MEKILFINACVRKNSRTKQLADILLKKLNGNVQEVNLNAENILPLDSARLEKRIALLEQKNYGDDFFKYAYDFAAAQTIVIAAPYWDLSFPAMLKIYFENICLSGVTFKYGADGIPFSLCKAKRLCYVSTAGGPLVGGNDGFEYVKKVCQTFFGIEKFKLFQAENLDVVGVDAQAILANVKKEIENDCHAERSRSIS